MTALRWAAGMFLVAGAAAAPLNLLHAHFFSGAELARVPLTRSGLASVAQAYAPLIITLRPEQSPVAVFLETEFAAQPGAKPDAAPGMQGADAAKSANRYVTHLISGNTIAAKADAVLPAGAGSAAARADSVTLLRTNINTAGLYTVLVSESATPAALPSKTTLTVRANTRRADAVNVLAGIAFMLIGAVTLFATGKRRAR